LFPDERLPGTQNQIDYRLYPREEPQATILQSSHLRADGQVARGGRPLCSFLSADQAKVLGGTAAKMFDGQKFPTSSRQQCEAVQFHAKLHETLQ